MSRPFVIDPNSSGKPRTHPDSALARLAGEQHGVVAGRQLLALGLSRKDIDYRLQVGRLHPVFRGVYAVGHRSLSQRGLFLASLLAIGDGAVLSHRAAAVLHGLWRWEGGTIDVTVARRVVGPKGIKVHAVRDLDPEDTTRRHGIPVTTPARTVLDLAPSLAQDALAHLVGQAEHARLVSVPSLKKDLTRWGPRPGTKRLAETIAAGPTPTAASWKPASSPSWTRTASPARKSTRRSSTTRSTGDGPLAQAADRERTATLEAAGYRVMRFTSDELRYHPDRAVARLRAALQAATRS